jgi:hypothetical protein
MTLGKIKIAPSFKDDAAMRDWPRAIAGGGRRAMARLQLSLPSSGVVRDTCVVVHGMRTT